MYKARASHKLSYDTHDLFVKKAIYAHETALCGRSRTFDAASCD